MQSRPGNPYDGHTLAGQIEQVERITGVAVARAYVDRGYRGHDVDAESRKIKSSSPARSAASRPQFVVNCADAPPSSPSSAT